MATSIFSACSAELRVVTVDHVYRVQQSEGALSTGCANYHGLVILGIAALAIRGAGASVAGDLACTRSAIQCAPPQAMARSS